MKSIIIITITLITMGGVLYISNSTTLDSGFDVNPLDNEQQLLDRMRQVDNQLSFVFKYKSEWCGTIGESGPRAFNKCVGEHIDTLKTEQEEIRAKLKALGSQYYQKP